MNSNTHLNEIDIGLAPMEGVTDFPARIWFSLTGSPKFMGTPFLRISEGFPKNKIPLKWCPEILDSSISDAVPYQTIPQFMTPTASFFNRSAAFLLRHCDFVELNCGCPAPKAVGKGAGSSILIDSDYFSRFINTIASEIGDEKLSVKIRSGYETTNNHIEIIDSLKPYKLHRLTIHGRTKAQGYKGSSDWSLIHNAANSLQIPVYGSGDVKDLSTFDERLTNKMKPKGLIIGRGALRNPWIFQEIRYGCPVLIDTEILKYSIASLAMLNELHVYNFESLCSLIRDRLLDSPPGKNLDLWRESYLKISTALYGKEVNFSDIAISRGSFGKTKMIWSYLRSSLPKEYFEPQTLRSKSIGEMTSRFDLCEKNYRSRTQSRRFKLGWDKEYDWIFAGEKRTEDSENNNKEKLI